MQMRFFVCLFAGATEQILSRGGQLIRKMRFFEFSKFLLYKSPILGVARAWATPVPTPLNVRENKRF